MAGNSTVPTTEAQASQNPPSSQSSDPTPSTRLDALTQRIGLSTPLDDLGLDEEERLSLSLSLNGSSLDSDASISLRSSLFDDSSAASSIASKSRGRIFEIERRKHDALVSSLREQIHSLEHEKRILENDFDREQRRFHTELIGLRKTSDQEIQRVKEKLRTLEEEIPQLRKRLQISKADLVEISCSQAMYHELKQVPSEKLTIREHVLVSVFELEAKNRRELANLQEKLSVLDADLEASTREGLKKDAEIRRLEQGKTDVESCMGTEVSRLQLELEKCRARLEERSQEASMFREKSQQYDAIQARCDSLERDRASSIQQASISDAKASAAETEVANLQEKVSLLLQEKDLISTDKVHLEREVDGLRRDVSRLKHLLEREQEKKREAKRSKEKLRDQLQSVQAETRSAFEQKLDKEVEALKENNREQLDHMKSVHEQLANREIKSLRSAKEDAENRAEHLDGKVTELRMECDRLRLELSTKDAKEQALATELRADIQMKSFQLEQVSTTMEEKTKLIHKLELENEMYTKQMEVLKQEFVQLETMLATNQIKHDTQLTLLNDKISAYNAMEIELDTAVLQHASLGHDESNHSRDRLAAIPTAARRRVEQSVALAQKLIETENKLSKERKLRAEYERRCKELEVEIKQAKAAMDSVNHSDDYVMSTILSKEKAVQVLEDERDELKRALQKEKDRAERAKGAQRQLKEDLEKILCERKKLQENVQSLRKEREVPLKLIEPAHKAEVKEEEEDLVLEEVDAPRCDPLNSSVHSSMSTFVMYKTEEDSGDIPLPRWYRRLQQPMP